MGDGEQPPAEVKRELEDYREYVHRQTNSLVRDLTRVLFGDFDVVLKAEEPDTEFGNLAMMTNVAINSARNAIADKEQVLLKLRAQGEAVRAEKLLLETILETSDDGILYVLDDGTVAYANGSFWSLTGLNETDHAASSVEDLVETLAAQSDAPKTTLEPLLRAAREGSRAPVHTRFDLARPVARSFRVIWRPSSNSEGASSGEALGSLFVLRDITQIEEARKARDELLGNLAHEVRTPLTSIKGFIDLLSRGLIGPLDARQTEVLATVSKNVDRLTDLVANMLDADRVRIGVAKRAPTAVGPVIHEVLETERRRGQQRDLVLDVELEEDLVVLCDRPSLLQIVRNLISNAIKYTPGGRVSVRARRLTPGSVEILVEDSGIGIPRDELSRIFDRFYRSDHELVYAVGGTGVGLSIVKSFVESVDGQVFVESELGAGSSFRVQLPIATSGLRAG